MPTLEELLKLIKTFSTTSEPTLHLVIPTIIRIERLAEALGDHDLSAVRHFGIKLKDEWSERFDAEWRNFSYFRIAAALHPHTALLHPHAVEEFNQVMDIVQDSPLVTEEERVVPAAAAPPGANPFAAAAAAAGQAAPRSPFRAEVAAYSAALSKLVDADTAAKVDFATWWRNLQRSTTPPMSILPRIVRDVMAMPASSIDSESMFSAAGAVITKHRASLSPATAQAQILLSSWLRRDPDVVARVPSLAAPTADVSWLEDEAPADGDDVGDVEAAEPAHGGAGWAPDEA